MFDNSPYFNKNNHSTYESLVDRIYFGAKVSYESALSDLEKFNLRKPVESTLDHVVESLKDATDITQSVFGGSVVSALINSGVSYYSRKYIGLNIEHLKDVSYWTEAGIYLAVAFPILFYEKHKEGVPFWENVRHNIRFGVTGAALSWTVYQRARGALAEEIGKETGVNWEISSPASQLTLMFPFAFAMALLRKPMGYATDKTSEYIVETGLKIKNGTRYVKTMSKRRITKKINELKG